MDDSLIEIARIVKPLGIRGEVKIFSLSRTPYNLEKYKTFHVVDQENHYDELTVEHFRVSSNSAVLKFVGFDSREEVEVYRDCALMIHNDQLPPMDEDEYLIRDLIGMEVISDEGEKLGNLEDVWELPANDVYQVKNGNQELLIPAIADIVLNIDLERRRIVVSLIEGLRELTPSADTD